MFRKGISQILILALLYPVMPTTASGGEGVRDAGHALRTPHAMVGASVPVPELTDDAMARIFKPVETIALKEYFDKLRHENLQRLLAGKPLDTLADGKEFHDFVDGVVNLFRKYRLALVPMGITHPMELMEALLKNHELGAGFPPDVKQWLAREAQLAGLRSSRILGAVNSDMDRFCEATFGHEARCREAVRTEWNRRLANTLHSLDLDGTHELILRESILDTLSGDTALPSDVFTRPGGAKPIAETAARLRFAIDKIIPILSTKSVRQLQDLKADLEHRAYLDDFDRMLDWAAAELIKRHGEQPKNHQELFSDNELIRAFTHPAPVRVENSGTTGAVPTPAPVPRAIGPGHGASSERGVRAPTSPTPTPGSDAGPGFMLGSLLDKRDQAAVAGFTKEEMALYTEQVLKPMLRLLRDIVEVRPDEKGKAHYFRRTDARATASRDELLRKFGNVLPSMMRSEEATKVRPGPDTWPVEVSLGPVITVAASEVGEGGKPELHLSPLVDPSHPGPRPPPQVIRLDDNTDIGIIRALHGGHLPGDHPQSDPAVSPTASPSGPPGPGQTPFTPVGALTPLSGVPAPKGAGPGVQHGHGGPGTDVGPSTGPQSGPQIVMPGDGLGRGDGLVPDPTPATQPAAAPTPTPTPTPQSSPAESHGPKPTTAAEPGKDPKQDALAARPDADKGKLPEQSRDGLAGARQDKPAMPRRPGNSGRGDGFAGLPGFRGAKGSDEDGADDRGSRPRREGPRALPFNARSPLIAGNHPRAKALPERKRAADSFSEVEQRARVGRLSELGARPAANGNPGGGPARRTLGGSIVPVSFKVPAPASPALPADEGERVLPVTQKVAPKLSPSVLRALVRPGAPTDADLQLKPGYNFSPGSTNTTVDTKVSVDTAGRVIRTTTFVKITMGKQELKTIEKITELNPETQPPKTKSITQVTREYDPERKSYVTTRVKMIMDKETGKTVMKIKETVEDDTKTTVTIYKRNAKGELRADRSTITYKTGAASRPPRRGGPAVVGLVESGELPSPPVTRKPRTLDGYTSPFEERR